MNETAEGRKRRRHEWCDHEVAAAQALVSAAYREKHPTRSKIVAALRDAYDIGLKHGAEIALAHTAAPEEPEPEEITEEAAPPVDGAGFVQGSLL